MVDISELTFVALFAQGQAGNPISIFFPLILMFVVMYLLFWAPEKKKRAQVDNMQRELKKNDKIVTIGGIFGTVVNTAPDSPEVTIRVDDGNNTRIRILRNAIAQKRDDSGDGKDKKED